MNRIVAAVLAAASCAGIAQAQEVSVGLARPPLTLARALEMAGASAPSLDAASAERRSADAARTVAGLRPNPSITLEAENVAGSRLFRGVNSVEATTSLSLPVELGGKRAARIAVADAQSGRAAVQSAVAQADLRFAVTQAFVDATAAERRLATAREQQRIAGDAEHAASVRVRAGRASPIEEQRAGVVRIQADAALERAARQIETARFVLAQRIRQAVTGPLDGGWFDGVVARRGPMLAMPSEDTLALAAARADVSTATARVTLARSRRVPDLTLSAGARRLEITNDTAAVFSLSFPLPVFNSGNAAVAQASAERQRVEARQRMTKLEVNQAIAEAQAEVANAATSAISASGPALAAAAEAARIARIGYREGKFGQFDLLDAERTLAATRSAATDALAAYHIAQARLVRLTTPAPVDRGQ